MQAPKNPFTRQNLAPDRMMQSSAAVATTNLPSQIPAIGSTTVRQQPTVVVTSSKQLTGSTISPYSLSQATNIPEKQPSFSHSSVYVQTPSSDISLAMKKNITTANASSVNLTGARSPLAMRADGMSNVKPVPNLSIQQEGLSNSFPQSFMLNSATKQQRHPHMLHQAHFTEPSYRDLVHSYPPQVEKSGPVTDMWRVRQDMPSSYHSQRNHNNYNSLVGERVPMQSGSLDRNSNHGREGFESWSPENSPTRNPRYVPGRNYPESRMNHVRNHRPEWSRQRGSSGHWDPGRQHHGNRKWNDQRR